MNRLLVLSLLEQPSGPLMMTHGDFGLRARPPISIAQPPLFRRSIDRWMVVLARLPATERFVWSLALDRSCGQPFNQVLLQREEEDHDGHADQDGSCGKVSPLCAVVSDVGLEDYG